MKQDSHSRGIGAGFTSAFIDFGYKIISNASTICGLCVGAPQTTFNCNKNCKTAIFRLGAVDVVVNNADIFFTKPFTGFTD